jgi:hypothetical protein
MLRAWATAILLAAALPAAAQSAFPTRLGESGMLDVPDGESLPAGSGRLGGELRYDRTAGARDGIGPLPLSLGVGLGRRLEAGLAMRQGGFPGDPRDRATAFSGALKFQALEASGFWPAVAVDAVWDRFNLGGVASLRAAASTPDLGRFRVAAFAGAESPSRALDLGLTAGMGLTVQVRGELQTVFEAVTTPRGPLYGAAVRWTSGRAGLSLGFSLLPKDEGLRISLGVGILQAPRRRPAPIIEAQPAAAEPVKPAGPQFLDDRPRFRMKMAVAGSTDPTSRRQHFAQPPGGGTALRATPPPQVSAEERRERDQLALADQLDARLRRLQAAEGALANRSDRVAVERRRIAQREQELLARASGLEARERQARPAGKPGAKEQQLAEVEDGLRTLEADLAAQEKATQAEVDAAERREALARAQETARQAPTPVPVPAPGAERAVQLEIQERQLTSREAWLAALEDRLTATRDRIDRLEAGQKLGSDRLDATERRLAAREERLALAERRASGAPAAVAAAPAPAAAVTLLVKPPTSITRGAVAATPAAGERATTAAALAVLGAGGTIKDADRESIVAVARQAARSGEEILVWARAQNPGLIEEAARRAEEVKALVVAEGVPAGRVNTRATLRPSGRGVDVVVSAQRATSEAPATLLQPGEAGRRQVREALLGVRADVERCARGELLRRGLARAEIVLSLAVEPGGKVVSAAAGAPFGGGEMDACLAQAAPGWTFPGGDAGYTAEVPVTVLQEGAGP